MKAYIVVSCNTDGGDIYLEYTAKTPEEANECLSSAVYDLMHQFVENGYGDTIDDFEYDISHNCGWASCADTTYYYQVLEVSL